MSINDVVNVDVESCLVIATSQPQPGNRNDTTVYRDLGVDQTLAGRPVMADGGYRSNHGVIMPYLSETSADQDYALHLPDLLHR